jgi:hypothetical protein
MNGASLVATTSDNLVSRSALAALLVDTIRELSEVRAAYRAAVGVLAERERERRSAAERYEQLLSEHRRLRADVMQKAAAA